MVNRFLYSFLVSGIKFWQFSYSRVVLRVASFYHFADLCWYLTWWIVVVLLLLKRQANSLHLSFVRALVDGCFIRGGMGGDEQWGRLRNMKMVLVWVGFQYWQGSSSCQWNPGESGSDWVKGVRSWKGAGRVKIGKIGVGGDSTCWTSGGGVFWSCRGWGRCLLLEWGWWRWSWSLLLHLPSFRTLSYLLFCTFSSPVLDWGCWCRWVTLLKKLELNNCTPALKMCLNVENVEIVNEDHWLSSTHICLTSTFCWNAHRLVVLLAEVHSNTPQHSDIALCSRDQQNPVSVPLMLLHNI